MIRYFFRHIWESIKNLKRNFWMTFASVSMVAVTLTLVGVFAATLLNIQRVASGVENNVHINTYLQVDSTDAAKVIQILPVNLLITITTTVFTTKLLR